VIQTDKGLKRGQYPPVGATSRHANHVNTSLSSSEQVAPNFWTDPAAGIPYYITVQTPEGNATGGTFMFEIMQVDVIRVWVYVPQDAAFGVAPGIDAVARYSRSRGQRCSPRRMRPSCPAR
jgi:hypothetical protein